MLTGRWSTISSWQALCYETLQGSLFFGSLDGYVWQGDTGGTDNGLTFSAAYLSQATPAGQFGQRSTAMLAHMFFKANTQPSVRLFARADDDKDIPSFNAVSSGSSTASTWDSGLWDTAVWDGVSQMNRYRFRQNVRATGDMLAVGCVVTSGGAVKLELEVDLATLQVAIGEASA